MRPFSVNRLIDAASIASKIDRKTLLDRQCRHAHVTRVRHAVCHLARETGMSYQRVGYRVQRDHSTVLHSCRQAKRMLASDPTFATFVERVRELAA